ncbi:MAG: ABC transporter permease [Nitrospirae bacterium]|nr:ABC transporter permease [Nitrospirota bacterium]MBI3595097.1 ABC transporter permease [Nitrospirota bacterium]
MKITKNKFAVIGFCLLVTFILAALFAVQIAPFDPSEQHLQEGLNGPSTHHLLGQDKLGRDILSRMIYGSRISLLVGLSVVSISLMVGLLIGSIAGYFGGVLDEVIMRLVDVFLAFPGILLAIAITAVLGPSLRNVLVALCIMGWVGYARIIRGQILSVRELEYVQAAQANGASTFRVLIRHILPNIMAPVIIEATFGMAGAIIAEAGLSFLGLGVQPPTPSWGSMLAEGRQFLLLAPHLTTFPGIAIMLTVLGLNFVGDGMRDAMDVRQSNVP